MSVQPPDAGTLDIPLDELPLSADFKERCGRMGFGTLRAITECDKHWLHDHLYFDMDWYMELLRFLREKGLLGFMNR